MIIGAMDTVLAFPNLVLLLAVTYLIGASLTNITLVLGGLVIPVAHMTIGRYLRNRW